jgi:hypothetical protein
MTLVRTQLNREEHFYTGKKFTQKSQTIPHQALTMREILTRHASGTPITGRKMEPTYGGEEMDGINLKTLDLSELADIAEQTKETINNYRKTQENAQKAAQKAKLDQDIENEVQKRLNDKKMMSIEQTPPTESKKTQ